MVDLVFYLINILFFGIPLLYYYIHLWSSIISSLCSGDIYLSSDIFLSNYIFSVSNLTVFELFYSEVLKGNFVTDFITSQITNCFNSFLNCSFWGSFKCICSRLVNMIKKFLAIFTTWIFFIFYNLVYN